ncbi:FAD-binding oxidoreductase [Nocardia iowensis]|uniref:FAD-binding oxidoreductase n=1 Tax=Nocardia iowensis TaxID=204891 RepID=A0ABX8RP03_NOCIO|nr:FAD-binding oxidoreductase [Nocardia iowensis]QXN90634.1 FAD-binding oxidoreductase [Nocardia iowensis]
MAFEELRGALTGRVLLPGDAGFDGAARPWALTVTQPVAAVVQAANAEDVAAVVAYARRAGVPVVAQPTGHGASGGIKDAILLRTGRLDSVHIDAERRVARVGAGANWGQVQAAAAAHGLTGLAGSNPVVGVTGYTLGGGLSWFGRKYGWASDAVRAFEIVDPTGSPARVTAANDPELFWALRGGGGDFAVVTALEFDLFPAPALYGGRVLWPGNRTRAVFEAFQEITASAPDELSVWFHRLQFPDAPPMVALDAAYLGDAAAGRALLARLDAIEDPIADTRGVLPVASLGDITAEPTDPSPSVSRAELLTDLGDAVLKTLVDEPVSPLVDIQIRHLGGALAQARPEGGARGPVTEPYLLYALGLGLPHRTAAVKARNVEVVDAISGHISGLKPYTFLTPDESAAAAFDEATLTRLRAIKRARDTQSVIRANYPVSG